MNNIDEELRKLEEKENEEDKEIEKIIKSGKKKIVDDITYAENFCPGSCRYCMNLIFETDECKYNLPINEECQEWEYIYETEE